MTKSALLELLAENQVEELFSRLKTLNNRDLILLESQWNDLQERQRLGVVDEEQASLEEARIRHSLLEIIERNYGNPTVAEPAPAAVPNWLMANKQWLIPTILSAVIFLVIALVFKPFGAGESGPKQLRLPTAPFSISSQQAGVITWQLLKAERTEFNPASWRLRIQAKCINPPYGMPVTTTTAHLRHGQEEIAPYSIEFPYVERNTSQTGTFDFEVPKTWKKALLVIYHQEYDVPKEVAVEIDLR